MSTIEPHAIDPTEKFSFDQTKLNMMVYLRRGDAEVSIDDITDYLTVKTYKYIFNVNNNKFHQEEIPSGYCDLD